MISLYNNKINRWIHIITVVSIKDNIIFNRVDKVNISKDKIVWYNKIMV